MKNIEICYANSMKINKGQYEQEAPFYSAKTLIEANGQPIDEAAEYNRLRNIIDPLLLKQYQESKADMAGVRIRIKDGKKYPSVTSVLHPDSISAFIDPEYAIRGTEIDRIVSSYIQHAAWEEPRVPLQKLKYEDIKYKEFFETHEKELELAGAILKGEYFNKKYMISCEPDIQCQLNNIETLGDFKTGEWDWRQLVANWKCVGDPEIEQLAIFDLKNNKIETLDPRSAKAQDYWESFLIKLGEFRARFGK